MCGIVGIWNLDGQPVSPTELNRFTDSLAHRGPDGRGTYINEEQNLGFGHRRLAILDTSTLGGQPFHSDDKRFWVTYNGEIYNFIELRQSLVNLGHVFRTQTDTEVLLKAYLQWGESFLLKLNGMWAFAIWDQTERSLFIARDRFGVKPIHYLFNGRLFAFASEVKAFMSLDSGRRPDFDPEIVALMANLESVERSILKNVKILGPGEKLVVNNDGVLRKHRWWNTHDHLHSISSIYKDQVDQLRATLIDSCGLRLRSDVRIATALSGGLDSSSVIAGIYESGSARSGSRLPADWQSAYIFDYVNTPHSEKYFAEMMADAVGAEKRLISGDQNTITLENIIDATYSLETIKNREPLIGPWLLYRAMRNDGVSVSIDGHGGDELLGGYISHVKAALKSSLLSFSPNRYSEVAKIHQELLGGALPEGVHRESTSLPKVFRDFLPRKKSLKQSTVGGINFVGDAFFGDRWASIKEQFPISAGESMMLAKKGDPIHNKRSPGGCSGFKLGFLGRKLYDDFHNGTLPKILRNFDRASMAHGIEVRAPMMDWRFVTLCFSLPDSVKIGGGYTKRILRDAFASELPQRIRQRKDKKGFASPIESWYQTLLREFVLDEVNSRTFLESEIWNGPNLRDFVTHCYEKNQYQEATKSWKYVQASILMREFKVRNQ